MNSVIIVGDNGLVPIGAKSFSESMLILIFEMIDINGYEIDI